MTFYEENRRLYNAWFEYAEPGLLTNRSIRNFLNGYRPDSWPDVVKLTLLCGIATLRDTAAVVGAVVPLEKIRQLVRRLEASRCIEEKLPPIQEKMKDLRGDVQEILEAFEEGSRTQSSLDQQKENAASRKEPKQPRQIERPPGAHGTYPDWWGDGAAVEKAGAAEPTKRATCRERPPPQLCYSVPSKPQKTVDEDDIVEPKHHLHKFNPKESTRSPKAVPQTQGQSASFSNIADAFLKDPWTSALCESNCREADGPSGQAVPPGVDGDDPAGSDNEPDVSETAHRELTVSTPSPSDVPRPRSASFWIDLNEGSPSPATAHVEQRTNRSRRGCVLDFGHLEAPRFPPTALRSRLSDCDVSAAAETSCALDFGARSSTSSPSAVSLGRSDREDIYVDV